MATLILGVCLTSMDVVRYCMPSANTNLCIWRLRSIDYAHLQPHGLRLDIVRSSSQYFFVNRVSIQRLLGTTSQLQLKKTILGQDVFTPVVTFDNYDYCLMLGENLHYSVTHMPIASNSERLVAKSASGKQFFQHAKRHLTWRAKCPTFPRRSRIWSGLWRNQNQFFESSGLRLYSLEYVVLQISLGLQLSMPQTVLILPSYPQ